MIKEKETIIVKCLSCDKVLQKKNDKDGKIKCEFCKKINYHKELREKIVQEKGKEMKDFILGSLK